ncbi:MAG: GNAT family N-acetyltransferase [Pseudomonadota bacterium]
MAFNWIDTLEAVDWHELSELYRVAPLGEKSPANLNTTFTNSMFKCLVYDGGKLVGAGRVLADGIDCAYICDVALLPDYQGCGLGKQIVAKLVALSGGHKKIILYAVPGKEPYYQKFGFRRMRTAMAIFADPAQAQASGYIDASQTPDPQD